MGRYIDLTGKQFGRWTVIERAENRIFGGKPAAFWKCKCTCGTIRDVNGRALKDGTSVSCGCFQKEQVRASSQARRRKNHFSVSGDTVTVSMRGGVMLCDKEDWDKFSEYYWFIAKDGYPTSCIDGKFKKFHVLILDCPSRYERDHINGNRADNRRKNLRIIPASANRFNRGLDSRNKSGHAGVFWYERYKKYQASIKAGGKTVHLGYYENYDEAVRAREEAEKKYFGEYRRQ